MCFFGSHFFGIASVMDRGPQKIEAQISLTFLSAGESVGDFLEVVFDVLVERLLLCFEGLRRIALAPLCG